MRSMISGLTAALPAVMDVGDRRWRLLAPATTDDKEGKANIYDDGNTQGGEAAGRAVIVSPQVAI